MKKNFVILLCVLLAIVLLCGTVFALAADENPLIRTGETHEGDFIAGGSSVANDGVILGDLIAGAQVISVPGSVEGDIIGAALNDMNISGEVGGSVRVASSNVSLESRVERNIMIFGNTIDIGQNAVVNRNAYLFGTTINTNGNIKGDTTVYGSVITLGGSFGGNVVINDMVEGSSLNFLEGTVIKGKLTYKGINEYQVPSFVQVGDYEYVQIDPASTEQVTPIFDPWQIARKIFTLGAYYLFALLLYKLFPRFFVRSGDFISAKPISAAGIGIAALGSLVGGLLLLILLFILSIFLFNLSIFFFVGFVLTFIAVLTIIFADLPVSLWLGKLFLGKNISVPARLAVGLGAIAAVKYILDLLGNVLNGSTFSGVLLFLINMTIWILGTGSLLRIVFDIFKSANVQAEVEENELEPIKLIDKI